MEEVLAAALKLAHDTIEKLKYDNNELIVENCDLIQEVADLQCKMNKFSPLFSTKELERIKRELSE
tara:strand:+ start:377 stop:574 length:198 start_codon:yes stop_codon:yes gene_type:complete